MIWRLKSLNKNSKHWSSPRTSHTGLTISSSTTVLLREGVLLHLCQLSNASSLTGSTTKNYCIKKKTQTACIDLHQCWQVGDTSDNDDDDGGDYDETSDPVHGGDRCAHFYALQCQHLYAKNQLDLRALSHLDDLASICQRIKTTTTTVLWPLDCVRDYLCEPAPEGKTRKVKPIWIYWSKR